MHLKSGSETTNHTNNNNTNNNGNAIVRVDTAADEGLDELFKAVMSPNDGQSRLPQQVPMRQRRLPPSFFRPPSAASSTNSLASASHSRESSLDGGYQSQGQTPITPNTNGGGQNKINNSPLIGYNAANGLAIIHPRANSSPAALPPASLNTGGSATGNTSLNGQGTFGSNDLKSSNDSAANQISHYRQMSYDLDQIRLPDGWEMSYTASGERYFLNHKEKTTTWEDPRKKIVEEMLRRSTPPPPPPPPAQPIIQSTTTVPTVSIQAANQVTSSTVVSVHGGGDQEHLSYIDPSIVPLPDGWEQAQTSSGDIYFISHIDQTTTWFHPSIPRNLQMKRIQQQSCSIQPPPFQNSSNIPPELVVALKNMNTSCQTPPTVTATASTTQTQNPLEMALKSQQNQHLRDLELERERMKQRQEELLQSSLLNNTASNIMLSSSTEAAASPFLSLQNECHSRQESIDSGLDLGNSSNFSMPHTPDDFLRMSNNTATSTAVASVATATNPPNTNTAAISDDIAFENMQISGLDLDSESMDFMQGLDMDLLSNVEELLNSNKDNIITWL